MFLKYMAYTHTHILISLNRSLFFHFHLFQIKDLKSEFLAYKDRAHALLQKKDAEISAAKDSELFKAQEEALNVYFFP